MDKIVAVVNQKGGVGKSTTAQAVAFGLAQRGNKVLLIDLDSQCNLTYSVGASMTGPSILGVLTGELKTQDAIQHLEQLDVIGASKFLSNADNTITETGKEYKLKEALEHIKNEYDFIVIDTPPSIGVLTINALTVADSIIIPCQADVYSLSGINQLADNLTTIKKYCNPTLQVEGILLTRYNDRTILSKDIKADFEEMAKQLNSKVFKQTIREGIVIKEAQAYNKDIFSYNAKANAVKDYNNFIEELLK